MNRPIILCRLRRHRVFHLRLDEELQDVGVLLVLVLVAVAALGCVVVVVVVVATAADLWAQHQVTVVETTLHGLVHDVEPGPRLHHPHHAVLALIGLLQILQRKNETNMDQQQYSDHFQIFIFQPGLQWSSPT